MNIMERLEASADWVEQNALYHFGVEMKHAPYMKSQEAVKTMREAAKLMRDSGFGQRPFARELPHIPV